MQTATDRLHLSSRQLADLAGVSYRQIDYWCRMEVITPSVADARGSGSRRLFSRRDALVVSVVGHLSQLGVDCTEVGEAAAELAEREEWGGLVFVTFDGRLHTELPMRTAAAWLIDLDEIERRFDAALDATPEPEPA